MVAASGADRSRAARGPCGGRAARAGSVDRRGADPAPPCGAGRVPPRRILAQFTIDRPYRPRVERS